MWSNRQPGIIVVCSVLMVTLASGPVLAAEQPSADAAPEFRTDLEKASYLVGTQVVGNLRAQGVEINSELFIRGIRDALAGKQNPFSPQEQRAILMEFQRKIQAKRQAEQAKREAAAMEQLGPEKAWKLKLTKPELMTFDTGTDYFWVLETNKGLITIKLMPEVAPMHVTSTIFLTRKGFYDDTTFHRVIPGFMAQGGDPVGTGRGGPGYQYAGEFDPNVKHDRPFLLSMANAGPNTDGSQFFITFRPTPHLDGKHTIFGEVVEGQDTVKKLEAAGTPGAGKPKEPLIIQKARIEEKPK